MNRQVTTSATLIMFIVEFKKVTTGQILTRSYSRLEILLTKDNYAFSQRTFDNSFVSLFLTKLACLFQLLFVQFVINFLSHDLRRKGQVRHSYEEALLRWKAIFLHEKFVLVGKKNPSEKAKVFSRPIRIFRKFFEGELRQWCSYLGSFRQWPFLLLVTRRTSVFCRFCYEFFNHLRSVSDIHINFNKKNLRNTKI